MEFQLHDQRRKGQQQNRSAFINEVNGADALALQNDQATQGRDGDENGDGDRDLVVFVKGRHHAQDLGIDEHQQQIGQGDLTRGQHHEHFRADAENSEQGDQDQNAFFGQGDEFVHVEQGVPFKCGVLAKSTAQYDRDGLNLCPTCLLGSVSQCNIPFSIRVYTELLHQIGESKGVP